MLAVWAPAPHLAIAVIADVGAHLLQHVEQPGLPERRRRLLLAGREGTRALGTPMTPSCIA